MPKVIELTDEDFKTSIDAAPLAFVDFYASWCGPCRLFAPLYSKVAERTDGIAFFKIDGDAHPQARADISIDNLPYVAAFRNGVFIEGFSTTIEASLEAFIARLKEVQ